MPLIGITLGQCNHPTTGSPLLVLRPYYTNAVTMAGGTPIIIPPNLNTDQLRTVYERLDGLVISGGGDMDSATYDEPPSDTLMQVDRDRDDLEIQLARWSVEEDKPLLAICRGHQVLNVALGGTLIQDIKSEQVDALQHDRRNDIWFERISHTVDVPPGTLLARTMQVDGAVEVNSLHHQAIKKLGAGLEITARAEDGIIEGIEIPDKRFILGVQWHPEALVHRLAYMRRLFEGVVQA